MNRGNALILILLGVVVTIVGLTVAGITLTQGILPVTTIYYTYKDPAHRFSFLYPPSLTLHQIDKTNLSVSEQQLRERLPKIARVRIYPLVALRPTITQITSWPDFREPTMLVFRLGLNSEQQAIEFMRAVVERAELDEDDIANEYYIHLSVPAASNGGVATGARPITLGAIYSRTGSDVISVAYGPYQDKTLARVVASMVFYNPSAKDQDN